MSDSLFVLCALDLRNFDSASEYPKPTDSGFEQMGQSRISSKRIQQYQVAISVFQCGC